MKAMFVFVPCCENHHGLSEGLLLRRPTAEADIRDHVSKNPECRGRCSINEIELKVIASVTEPPPPERDASRASAPSAPIRREMEALLGDLDACHAFYCKYHCAGLVAERHSPRCKRLQALYGFAAQRRDP